MYPGTAAKAGSSTCRSVRFPGSRSSCTFTPVPGSHVCLCCWKDQVLVAGLWNSISAHSRAAFRQCSVFSTPAVILPGLPENGRINRMVCKPSEPCPKLGLKCFLLQESRDACSSRGLFPWCSAALTPCSQGGAHLAPSSVPR